MNLIRTRKTYSSCNELPLHNFIMIVVKNDLSMLYSEPNRFIYKEADLNEIWHIIFTEYNELTKNESAFHVLSLVKDITVINFKLQQIQSAVDILFKYRSAHHFPELIDMLKSMGFIRYSYSDETIENDLRSIIMEAKKMVFDLQQHEREYKEATEDNGKSATIQDYIDLIAQLSKYMGFPIDKFRTTVSEFISYLNDFKRANTPKDGK